MIYFDNAATGGFKPRAVFDAAENVMRYLSANPGRSGHRLSVAGANIVYECRRLAADIFGSNPERVIFTKNCTEALNTAIFGTLNRGGHVITTVYEHNSVLRPLYSLQKKGLISFDTADDSEIDIVRAIEDRIRPETYLIVINAVSNVTGKIMPIDKIGALAKKHNLLFIVDGAQAGGHIPVNVEKSNITALALAGHKGLYGIMGSGLLILSETADVTPLCYGGTGSESFSLSQPEYYPERLESGTLNLPAIAALSEGLSYLKNNMKNFADAVYGHTSRLIEGLSGISRVKCFSEPNPAGIVSFRIEGIESSDASDILSSEYDIGVRGGLHCAPLVHKKLGTSPEGLIRASLAVQNSSREIDFFIRAVKNICSK